MSEDLTKKLPASDKDEILTAIKKLDARLGRLEQTVDERLYDTRPMWHRLEADIGQLRTGVERLETAVERLEIAVERLEKGQEELRSSVSDVSRDQIVINDVVRKIQLDFHAIDDRLHRLEVNRN